MYKGLCKLAERFVKKETAVSAYLTMLIIAWTILVILTGVVICGIKGNNIVKCLADITCAGAYAGILLGLCGGLLFLHKNIKI